MQFTNKDRVMQKYVLHLNLTLSSQLEYNLGRKKNGGALLFQLYWCGGPWPESPQVLFVSVDLNAGDMIIDVCMTENNYERQYAWLILIFINETL